MTWRRYAGLTLLAVVLIGALAYEILHFPPLSAPAQNAILGVMTVALAVNVGTFFYVDQWLILGDYLTGREDAETFFDVVSLCRKDHHQ